MTGRIALYAAPGTGSDDAGAALLLERAEAWLGRSVGSRVPSTAPPPPGWSQADIDAITIDARRYGFHGTLKAPFRLAEGCTIEDVEDELARFAASASPIVLPRVALARIGEFFALVPGAPAGPLHALAGALVTGFDRFRAPATPAETARRRPEELTPRQRELLEDWGYPYVLDEFRFHLTLTDRVPHHRHAEVHDVLADWFGDCLGRDIPIEAITLFREPEAGAPFVLHSLHPFSPASSLTRIPSALDLEGTP